MGKRIVLRVGTGHPTDCQATLTELHALCDRALADAALWPQLADSFLAGAHRLRTPAATALDKLLVTIAGCAELTTVRIRAAALRSDEEAVRFAVERSIKALQQLILTALGILQGKVFLLRP